MKLLDLIHRMRPIYKVHNLLNTFNYGRVVCLLTDGFSLKYKSFGGTSYISYSLINNNWFTITCNAKLRFCFSNDEVHSSSNFIHKN